MAALSGVWFFDQRPIDDASRQLVRGLEPLAPDGVSLATGAGMAMAFGARHVWTGEAAAQQPIHGAGGLVATWDGRLDNRDDLLLCLDGRLSGDASDAGVALAVFERWGIDGLRSLIGDWSLAIWDNANRVLHLARDYMGVRPLYYHLAGDAVMWASSLGELAARTGRIDDLDEGFVARFMALQFSTDVTPYRGIRGVPTATCVSISATGVETRRRFWRLEPGIVRYRDDGQYEEHLRALWAEAVGCRLRSSGTVWAELSGGLDSSSVVCMADALIKAGRVPATRLQPVSHVTLLSAEGDERRFVAEVEARTGLQSVVLGIEMHAPLRADWNWVTPVAPQGVQIASAQRINDSGGCVLLSGRGGDLVMGCDPDNSVALFDDLSAGRLAVAMREIRCWSRATRKPVVEIALGLMRVLVKHSLLSNGRTVLSQEQQAGLDLLAAGMRASVSRSGDSGACHGVRVAQAALVQSVLTYSLQAQLQTHVEELGPNVAHPYFHRPLVDYMLAIPGEQLSAPGQMRALMRRAFEGLLPARVVRRISKGYYPPAAMRAVRPLAQSLLPLEQAAIVRRGWFDAERLDSAVRALLNSASCAGPEVQRAVRLEQWLRDRERRGPAATPQGKEVKTNELLIA